MRLKRPAWLRWITAPTTIDVALILCVGLLPLTWFRGRLIASMDLPFPLIAPHLILRDALSAWQTNIGLGHVSIFIRLLVYGAGGSLLESLGFSLLDIERLLFVFWFAGAGLSSYFLMRVLLPCRRLASLTAALFYMLNPYAMILRWYELNFWSFFYALVPFLLGAFVMALRDRAHSYRWIVAFLVGCLLASPSFANVAAVAVLALMLGIYLVVYLWQQRRQPREMGYALGRAALVAVLFVATNLWWIVPLPASLALEAGALQTPEGTSQRVVNTSYQSTWARVLRLRGYWAFNWKYSNTADPMIRYAQTYNRIPGYLGWLVLALAAIGLWSARRHPTLVWAMIFLLGGSFFMKGVQPPLANVTTWLYQHVFLMSMFRHPFDKFGLFVVLGMAPLVGLGMDRVLHAAQLIEAGFNWRSGIFSRLVVGAASVVLLGVIPWPMWTGDAIAGPGETIPSARVIIPPEYQAARTWLAEQTGQFRVLPLPLNTTLWSGSLLDWYMGYEPTAYLLDSDVAAPSDFPGGAMIQAAAESLLTRQPATLAQLSRLNVKYILLHGDANFPYLGHDWMGSTIFLPQEQMEATLASQPAFELAGQFGQLTLYRNRDWQPLGTYATTDALLVTSVVSQTASAGVLIEAGDAATIGLTAAPPASSTPGYSVEQVTPWLVRLHVASQAPFFVVHSQAFEPHWQAYAGSPGLLRIFTGQAEPAGRHFQANGYANGWYFEQPGTYELTLCFLPQRLLYVGLLASALAWLLLFVYFVVASEPCFSAPHTPDKGHKSESHAALPVAA